MLTTLLDEHVPYIAGCEIHDNPYAPDLQALPRSAARKGRRDAHRLAVAAKSAMWKNWPRRTSPSPI